MNNRTKYHLMYAAFCSLVLPFVFSCQNKSNENKTSKAKQTTEAVRGTWLTNVKSDVLHSKNNIINAVEQIADMGFNTIFVVTWNDQYTTYPSQVTQRYLGHSIQKDFLGRDPLKELIEAAHAHKIKVFAWFEFGFAASINDDTGGRIIQKHPHWASRQQDGNITTKNKFQWLNPFHPEVQTFISELILEVVNNYDIDGIQGDDRLPALPSNGGYDDYTTQLYQQEHSNRLPPKNTKEYHWVKWRSQKLNLYLQQLVSQIHQANPDILISMSPSIYPWSEENYLQDWPSWVNMGLVDILVPQIYRYNFDSYKKELEKIITQQINNNSPTKFYPGILLQVNDYLCSTELLDQYIALNRKHGIYGEVYFFYEGLPKRKNYFTKKYADSVAFPTTIQSNLKPNN